jgi:hypothetical protein
MELSRDLSLRVRLPEFKLLPVPNLIGTKIYRYLITTVIILENLLYNEIR